MGRDDKISERIPCPTPQALQAEVDALASALDKDERDDTFEKFIKAILRFAAVTRGGGYKHRDVFVRGVGNKGVGLRLVDCMLSDRTRLSAPVTEFLGKTIAPRLKDDFAPLVHLYLPPLVRLLGRPNKVYVKRANECLLSIISNCHHASILLYLRTGLDEKSDICRRHSILGIESAVLEWSDTVWHERDLEVLELSIQKAAVDKDSDVRKTAKRVWALFTEVWPSRVEDFTTDLTPTIRRYLDIPLSDLPSKPKSRPGLSPPPRAAAHHAPRAAAIQEAALAGPSRTRSALSRPEHLSSSSGSSRQASSRSVESSRAPSAGSSFRAQLAAGSHYGERQGSRSPVKATDPLPTRVTRSTSNHGTLSHASSSSSLGSNTHDYPRQPLPPQKSSRPALHSTASSGRLGPPSRSVRVDPADEHSRTTRSASASERGDRSAASRNMGPPQRQVTADIKPSRDNARSNGRAPESSSGPVRQSSRKPSPQPTVLPEPSKQPSRVKDRVSDFERLAEEKVAEREAVATKRPSTHDIAAVAAAVPLPPGDSPVLRPASRRPGPTDSPSISMLLGRRVTTDPYLRDSNITLLDLSVVESVAESPAPAVAQSYSAQSTPTPSVAQLINRFSASPNTPLRRVKSLSTPNASTTPTAPPPVAGSPATRRISPLPKRMSSEPLVDVSPARSLKRKGSDLEVLLSKQVEETPKRAAGPRFSQTPLIAFGDSPEQLQQSKPYVFGVRRQSMLADLMSINDSAPLEPQYLTQLADLDEGGEDQDDGDVTVIAQSRLSPQNQGCSNTVDLGSDVEDCDTTVQQLLVHDTQTEVESGADEAATEGEHTQLPAAEQVTPAGETSALTEAAPAEFVEVDEERSAEVDKTEDADAEPEGEDESKPEPEPERETPEPAVEVVTPPVEAVEPPAIEAVESPAVEAVEPSAVEVVEPPAAEEAEPASLTPARVAEPSLLAPVEVDDPAQLVPVDVVDADQVDAFEPVPAEEESVSQRPVPSPSKVTTKASQDDADLLAITPQSASPVKTPANLSATSSATASASSTAGNSPVKPTVAPAGPSRVSSRRTARNRVPSSTDKKPFRPVSRLGVAEPKAAPAPARLATKGISKSTQATKTTTKPAVAPETKPDAPTERPTSSAGNAKPVRAATTRVVSGSNLHKPTAAAAARAAANLAQRAVQDAKDKEKEKEREPLKPTSRPASSLAAHAPPPPAAARSRPASRPAGAAFGSTAASRARAAEAALPPTKRQRVKLKAPMESFRPGSARVNQSKHTILGKVEPVGRRPKPTMRGTRGTRPTEPEMATFPIPGPALEVKGATQKQVSPVVKDSKPGSGVGSSVARSPALEGERSALSSSPVTASDATAAQQTTATGPKDKPPKPMTASLAIPGAGNQGGTDDDAAIARTPTTTSPLLKSAHLSPASSRYTAYTDRSETSATRSPAAMAPALPRPLDPVLTPAHSANVSSSLVSPGLESPALRHSRRISGIPSGLKKALADDASPNTSGRSVSGTPSNIGAVAEDEDDDDSAADRTFQPRVTRARARTLETEKRSKEKKENKNAVGNRANGEDAKYGALNISIPDGDDVDTDAPQTARRLDHDVSTPPPKSAASLLAKLGGVGTPDDRKALTPRDSNRTKLAENDV